MNKFIVLAISILISQVCVAEPTTTAKGWIYTNIEPGMAKSLTGGAEGSFVLNPTAGEVTASCLVYKKALPKDWKAGQDTRKWKILLASFNETNQPRTILKDSVSKNPQSKELSYSYEMNYMPFDNMVHHVLGTLKIKGNSVYLVLYDRRSAEYSKDLAAAKNLMQSIAIEE